MLTVLMPLEVGRSYSTLCLYTLR